MNDLALSTIELFAGVGMLGEGLRAGLAHLGIETRSVCYVEREAHAAAVLVARIEEGSLDPAPIWSDVITFPARQFNGKVDGIVAGFPCQDISVAGQRKGLDGDRSGLFFEIPRIADACGAWFMFLENVAGISSATATVMDETEGELEERAAARVVGELADLGWDSEWIVISASDVGASHGRARWFCFAWRKMANAEGRRGERQRSELAGRAEIEGSSEHMADAARNVWNRSEERKSGSRWRVRETSNALDYANGNGAKRTGREELCIKSGREELAYTSSLRCESRSRVNGTEAEMVATSECEFGAIDQCGVMANSDGKSTEWHCGSARSQKNEIDGKINRNCDGSANVGGLVADTNGSRSARISRNRKSGIAKRGAAMANAGGARPQGNKQQSAHEPDGRTQEPCRSTTQLHYDELFAPGPSDPRWARIISEFPWIAPALNIEQELDAKVAFAASQSLFCGMADGMAEELDFDNRAPRLKCCGNGVVPTQAAIALIVLARRAGIFE